MENKINQFLKERLADLKNLKIFCRDQYFFPDDDSGSRNSYRTDYVFVAVTTDNNLIATDNICRDLMGSQLGLESPNEVNVVKVLSNQNSGTFYKSIFIKISVYVINRRKF